MSVRNRIKYPGIGVRICTNSGQNISKNKYTMKTKLEFPVGILIHEQVSSRLLKPV